MGKKVVVSEPTPAPSVKPEPKVVPDKLEPKEPLIEAPKVVEAKKESKSDPEPDLAQVPPIVVPKPPESTRDSEENSVEKINDSDFDYLMDMKDIDRVSAAAEPEKDPNERERDRAVSEPIISLMTKPDSKRRPPLVYNGIDEDRFINEKSDLR